MIIKKKTKAFCNEMKMPDKCVFSDGWLESNKKLPEKIWSLYVLFDNLE